MNYLAVCVPAPQYPEKKTPPFQGETKTPSLSLAVAHLMQAQNTEFEKKDEEKTH